MLCGRCEVSVFLRHEPFLSPPFSQIGHELHLYQEIRRKYIFEYLSDGFLDGHHTLNRFREGI